MRGVDADVDADADAARQEEEQGASERAQRIRGI